MEPNADREALLVPVGTRLVHIGPSKTGTTSLQAAMWAGRDEMRAQGVRYAGRAHHAESAARALAGVNSPASDEGAPPPIRLWKDLVGDIRRAREPRLILSSEFLAHAQPDGIRRLVDDLDPARVRVAVTLRPLARILASQWQQTVQAGRTTSFDAWLDALFNRPEGKRGAAIWHRHRHDRLIARWAEVVGVDRVTVVVVDDRDHEQVLRAFEALLGLRPRTLELQSSLANRSLTVAEVEALRAFNEAYWAAKLGRPMHNDLVRLGAATHMKTRLPGPDEARIETPQWALDRAGEVAREMVAAIAASGVRVVGDLDRLTEVPVNGRGADARPVPVEAAPDVAASLSLGLVVAAGLARGARQAADAGGPSDVDLTRVTSRHLVKVVYGRMDTMARVRLRAVRRRVVAAGSR